MTNAAYLIAVNPTLILLWLIGAFRFKQPQVKALWTAVVFGALVTIPVWFVETMVETPANSESNLYQRAFQRQVLGAAVVEELALLLSFLLAYSLFRSTVLTGPYAIVTLAVAAAIGFTTVENLLAVLAAESPLNAAVGRLLSLVAGHATLQLIMGYFAALAFFGSKFRGGYLILMIAVPIAVHGWGDFSEAVFNAQEALDPTSNAAKNWFAAWILGLFLYVAFGITLLWQMNTTWKDSPWGSPPGNGKMKGNR